MSFTTEVKGIRRVKRNMRRLGKAANKEMESALFTEMEVEIIGPAKEIAPVDLGPLRASGHVKKPERRGGKVEVVGGFGGPAGVGNVGGETNDKPVGYALVQHERLDYRHSEGQQAKYVEQPAREASQDMAERVAVKLERAIDRNGL